MNLSKKYKIVLLGDSGVGKTQLVHHLLQSESGPAPKPTIGLEFSPKYLQDQNIELNFWDTGGQEKYRSIAKVHYRSSDAFLMVYDITNQISISNMQRWLDDVNEAAEQDVLKILVGNKIDLERDRKVSGKCGQKWAQERNMQWIQVSALKGNGMTLLFDMLLEKLKARHQLSQQRKELQGIEKPSRTRNIDQPPDKRRGCCG